MGKQILVAVSKSYANNLYKDKQNKAFTLAIQNSLKSQGLSLATIGDDSFIGVLDSVERNSCNALIQQGLKKQHILIVEHDPLIAERHVRAGFSTHIGSLFSFSDKQEYGYIYTRPDNNWYNYLCRGFFFDLCGLVTTGAKQVLETLRAIHIVPGAVFAVTFCRARIHAEKHIRFRNNFIDNFRRVLAVKHVHLNKHIDIIRYAGDGRGQRGAPMEFLLFTTY